MMSNGFYKSDCGLMILHARGLVAEFRHAEMCNMALSKLNLANRPRSGWHTEKIAREIKKVYRMVRCPNGSCYGSVGEGRACKRPSEHTKWGDDSCAARKDRFDEWLVEQYGPVPGRAK